MDEYSIAFCLPFPAEIQLSTIERTPLEMLRYFSDLMCEYLDSAHGTKVCRCFDVIEAALRTYHATCIRITQLVEINQIGFMIIIPYLARADAFMFEMIYKYPFLHPKNRWFKHFCKGISLYPWIHAIVPIPRKCSFQMSYDEKASPDTYLKSIVKIMDNTHSKSKLKKLQDCYDMIAASMQNRVARITVTPDLCYDTTFHMHFQFYTKKDRDNMTTLLTNHHIQFELDD